MPASALVEMSNRDGVGTLRLSRPQKRNAINSAMSDAICEAMDQLDEDSSVSVIVIEGSGGAFSAGSDLVEAVTEFDVGGRGLEAAARATSRVEASPKPIIAAIDGAAYGFGAALASVCDLRVMTARSRFRFIGVAYGVVVGAAALAGLVGGGRAKELLFTTRVVDANEALALGIANRVVPDPDALAATVEEMAATIARASPEAVAWTKRVVNAATGAEAARAAETEADRALHRAADTRQRFTQAARRFLPGGEEET